MNKPRDERLLEMTAPPFDSAGALARFRESAAGVTPEMTLSIRLMTWMRFTRSSWLRPATLVLATVVLIGTAAFTGLADTVLTIFEPRQIQTVQVDPSQFGAVPDPSQYGTVTWIVRPSPHPVTDLAAAAKEAGFTPLAPASLPGGIPAGPQLTVVNESKATFQFDAAKARAAAAKVNATIPPMPPAIAATTLTMSGGPAVMQRYGAPAASAQGRSFGAPQLVIVQAKAPGVTSNGASVQELRDYALAQPGVPPSVAAQIRAIGDPIGTLLVPVGLSRDDLHAVTVRGTQGFAVGDQTGIGGGVFWLERGYVIAVFGALKESDLLALANALH